MADLLVRRGDIRECKIVDSSVPEIGSGEALIRVETFGLTANNVTYAMFGEWMSYWDFFPAEEGWGRVPVWGFGVVERSETEGVEVGTRVYGYLPPSPYLVVRPGGAGPYGFVDASPHRAELPSVYHRYLAIESDPFYRVDTEAIQMLFRPLFFTSFLIDDQLADDDLLGHGPVVMSSASSKTAIAAAYLLSRREGVELIGLTSPGNVDFVEGLGTYDRTVSYDDIDSLPIGSAVFVDFAGDVEVRSAVHAHFGDELRYSMAVGATHWEEFAADIGELAGPAPVFFFAPTRVTKRSKDWGREGLESRVADAWHPFCEWVDGAIEVVHGTGMEAARETYMDLVAGRVEPAKAHVFTL